MTRPVLSVLGGGSVASPVLVEEIGRAQLRGELPPLEVRLHGRAPDRLQGVVDHARFRLARLRRDAGDAGISLHVSAGTDLEAALAGTNLVICQVRPGGMEARAGDEALSRQEGVPADEGLGPSGLACFLRGRPVMDGLARAVSRRAPASPFLLLTGPLGLNVAFARRLHAGPCYGVCELPAVTSERVRAAVEPRIGVGALEVLHAGLNHQAWLHSFRDRSGIDRTAEVIAAIDDPALLGVDPEVIGRVGAVPLPYLRLYYHRQREVEGQRTAARTRGAVLLEWQRSAIAAYGVPGGPNHRALRAILSERRLNWYRDGVVPAVAAFLGNAPRTIALNAPMAGSLPGVNPEAVVELPCLVSSAGVVAVRVPPLPPEPLHLTRELIRYEAAALGLGPRPDPDEIAEVLLLHPLVAGAASAARLGHAVFESVFGYPRKEEPCCA